MSAIGVAISSVLGLVALIGIGSGLWAVAHSTSQDQRIKRLQDERDDYLSRLNFIEPRHRAIEQQNEVLLALHDPTLRLESIDGNQVEILKQLGAQSVLIQQIDNKLDEPRGDKR